VAVDAFAPAEAFAPVEAFARVDTFRPNDALTQNDAFEELERIAADDAIEPVVETVERWRAQPVDQPIDESIDEASSELDEPMIDLSVELEAMSEPAEAELFDGEQVGVYTIDAEVDEPVAATFNRRGSIFGLEAFAAPAAAAALVKKREADSLVAQPVAETLFAELVVAETPAASSMFAESDFVEPPEPPRPDIEPWVPMYLSPGRMWPVMEGMPAETPAPRVEQPDWIELVASLRQDLERRRTDPAAAAEPIAVRPSDGPKADVLQLVKKPRPQVKKAKPVQDEWGFFDPEQCGFSTLLAKLNEITADT
jgi:hypothetical protein